jgi:uncharacterized protein (UPF0261 family)
MANKNKKTVSTADKYANIQRLPIDDRCEGCDRVQQEENDKFCSKYADPSFHWENDQICSFATHVKREIKVVKKIVNPLKASKRASAKKK